MASPIFHCGSEGQGSKPGGATRGFNRRGGFGGIPLHPSRHHLRCLTSAPAFALPSDNPLKSPSGLRNANHPHEPRMQRKKNKKTLKRSSSRSREKQKQKCRVYFLLTRPSRSQAACPRVSRFCSKKHYLFHFPPSPLFRPRGCSFCDFDDAGAQPALQATLAAAVSCSQEKTRGKRGPRPWRRLVNGCKTSCLPRRSRAWSSSAFYFAAAVC